MKLYLSSYKLGNNPEQLADLIGSNKKVAVIANAIDFKSDEERAESVQNNFDELKSIGLKPEELDLRNYFTTSEELRIKIKEYGLLWVRGGNVFVLRRAMKDSGFDEIVKKLKNQNKIVYGGYSAGVCVLSPTLEGLDIVDDSSLVSKTYNTEIIWEGLNILPYSVAPHYKSDHPESADVDKEVEYLIKNNIPFRTLRDGEVIIINTEEIL